ncbi:MAG TPA: bifunctional DNA-formamidopyrimidine glycosylase/DNA-(apurinic or apyrimidinic site) lyase [Ktedonobacteraceae bacterium]|nr:bifunctional DNA-formamidopyrimidine glycosylase/DNA-(apurinic or apyrimidinic site) lyase [Ktedonobacteraceae bacterium]
MPELPEVEYTARQLRGEIVGATISKAHVFWERTIGHPVLPDFLLEISERRIEGVRRRGKFLLLDLSGDLFLAVHRRMTGNFLLLPPGWRIDDSLQTSDPAVWSTRGPTFLSETPGEQAYSRELHYCRVCFDFVDGRRLLFTDPRKFGRIELWSRDMEMQALKALGPEPLGSEFSAAYLSEALTKRKTGIKQTLLDQTVVAGVGNIYADEALFHARIHPQRSSASLTLDEVRLLYEGIVAVLTLGIEHGGTSFNDYRDLWGEAGDNYNHVHVYKQEGRPCQRCGSLIERLVIAQRSAHFCPTCQRLTAE